MSTTPESSQTKALNFRRYKDGDHQVKRWVEQIFDAGATRI